MEQPPHGRAFGVIRRIAPISAATFVSKASRALGKELVASLIHRLSNRSPHAFIAMNCGYYPRLFSRASCSVMEKGSFTGADRRRLGKFELANQGTLSAG